jgi:predicted nucleic acid-binding protein
VIVLDSSAVVELLIGPRASADRVAERVRDAAPALAAPHLLDAEVGQVLRRFVLRGALTADRAREALDDLLDLPVARYGHEALLDRALELRANVSFYDALFLALAEALDATLLTGDRALEQIPGVRAAVTVL